MLLACRVWGLGFVFFFGLKFFTVKFGIFRWCFEGLVLLACRVGLGFGVVFFFGLKFFMVKFGIFRWCFEGLVLLACRVWGLGLGFF